MPFIRGSRVHDSRYNRYGVVDSVENKEKGILFKVKFDNGAWGSYYETTIWKRFSGVDVDSAPIQEPIEDSNVVYVDFKNKEKFANRATWDTFISIIEANKRTMQPRGL